MTKVYRFKAELEWKEEVWRIIEIRGGQTLHDLHGAIQSAFGWDDDHLYSFYLSGRHWDKASEYASPLSDNAERGADGAVIDSLDLSPGKVIAYLFDYGDQWRHRLELLEIVDEEPGTRYPRIVERRGQAPEQYRDWDEAGDETPRPSEAALEEELGGLAALAKRVRDAAKASIRGERLAKADLEKEYSLAMELFEAIRHDPSKLAPFEAYASPHLHSWLTTAPEILAEAGLFDEAARLCEAWAAVMRPEHFLSERAILLAQAGREGPAREQLGRNLERFPDDIWILHSRAGDAYAALKDHAAAEACYRRSMELADDQRDYDRVVARLIAVLEESGKTEEAKSLNAELRRGSPLGRLFEPRVPHMREAPKIGRNDPCPCGSGKKHKKCCLGKS